MKARTLAVCLAVAMLTVTAPSAMAFHLSAGGEDTVLTGVQESPDSQSVAGDEKETKDTPYGVGTTPSSQCNDVEANLSAQEARDAATQKGFCSDLVYNEDTEFVRSSPIDQDLRPAETEGKITIDEFDVQRAYYTGNLFGASFLLGFSGGLVGVDGLACVPICDDGDSTAAQNTTWNTVHEVGAEAGLTDGPEEASQNEDEADNDGRAQDTGVALHVRNAPGVIQDNTNAWQMNGWAIPFPTERFVGQLVDDEGNTITDDQLEDHVTTLVDEGILTKGTTPQICGYTPDINFRSTGEQSFCDEQST